MTTWKFLIFTFGCKVNQYESELIRENWVACGGMETQEIDQADYILINSCAITSRAERDARNVIGKIRRKSGKAKIILTGCAAQFYEKFEPRKNSCLFMPDICVPQTGKSLVAAYPLQGKLPMGLEDRELQNRIDQVKDYKRSRAVIKLQDGCSQGCSYCVVPQTRGRPMSRPLESILEECRGLCRAGFGELILSGVNLRQYKGNFWDMLRVLDRTLYDEFGRSIRLRISSLDPAMLSEMGIETLIECRLLCRHLHLSIQHASNSILKAMRRDHYTPEGIIKVLDRLRLHWGVMGLGADIISGFPGETIADADMLRDFLQHVPFTYAHVFPYSMRPGTAAAAMPNQIPKREKERRAKELRAIVKIKYDEFLRQQLEVSSMEVAPESPNEVCQKGVNEYYVPCAFETPVQQTKGLLRVRPQAIRDGKILVRAEPG